MTTLLTLPEAVAWLQRPETPRRIALDMRVLDGQEAPCEFCAAPTYRTIEFGGGRDLGPQLPACQDCRWAFFSQANPHGADTAATARVLAVLTEGAPE